MAWLWSSFKLCGSRMYYGRELDFMADQEMVVTDGIYEEDDY